MILVTDQEGHKLGFVRPTGDGAWLARRFSKETCTVCGEPCRDGERRCSDHGGSPSWRPWGVYMTEVSAVDAVSADLLGGLD